MNSEQINALINGLGMMTELYMIIYQNFKNQKMSDDDAIKHTKAFMAVMVEYCTNLEDKSE